MWKSCLAAVVLCGCAFGQGYEWQVMFEWSPDVEFTNTTIYPVTVQVPFEHSNGFVRVVARKVEVVDMKKMVMAAVAAILTNGYADLVIPLPVVSGGTASTDSQPPPEEPVVAFPVPTVSGPTGTVTWVGMDDFPTFTAATTDRVIANYSKEAESGDSWVFSTEAAITGMVAVTASSTNTISFDLHDRGGRLTVPSDDMVAFFPLVGGVTNHAEFVNRTLPWYIAPDESYAGGEFFLFGRNLGTGTKLWNEELETWLDCEWSNGYMAKFITPAGWANADYTLFAHNGQGRYYGFNGGISFTKADQYTWDSTIHTVSVHTASAIRSAISAASDGDTVYLTAGTYEIDYDLNFENKSINFEGADGAILTPASNYSTDVNLGKGLINLSQKFAGREDFFSVTNARIANITFAYGDGSLAEPESLLQVSGRNILIENCTFIQTNTPNIDVAGVNCFRTQQSHTYNVTIRSNLFMQAKPLIFGGQNTLYYKNTNMLLHDGGTDSSGYAFHMPSRRFAAFDNIGVNFDDSDETDGFGWGGGRWAYFNGNGSTGYRYHYLGSNTVTDFAVRYNTQLGANDPDQAHMNAGEIGMSEHHATMNRETIAAGTTNSFTFADTTDYTGYAFVVVDGPLFGFYGTIASSASGVHTIDGSFPFAATTNDTIAIGEYGQDVVYYGNDFSGRSYCYDPDWPRDTASAGGSGYGGVQGRLDKANTYNDIDEFITHRSLKEKEGDIAYTMAELNCFNEVRNNNGTNLKQGFNTTVYDSSTSASPYITDVACFGNIFCGNSLTNITVNAFSISAQVNYPIVQTVIENNTGTLAAGASEWGGTNGTDTYTAGNSFTTP